MQVAPQSYNNVLRVNRIRLSVRLGYEKEERVQAQHVEVDLAFFFPSLTEPNLSDKGDFICYDIISHALKTMCESKEFHLIEYLCMQMYEMLRARVTPEVKIALKLTKCQVPIPFVLAGASFSYSDVPPFSWTPPL
jgi:FolB domain-containing protein